MITGFNHSGFVVENLEKMITFYCDILGLSITREIDRIAPASGDHTGFTGAKRKLVFVGKPGSEHMLELVKYVEPISPEGHLNRNQLGAAHICFNVSNIKTLYEKLKDNGTKFVTSPIFKVNPDGTQTAICYLQDPEGNWIELIQQN